MTIIERAHALRATIERLADTLDDTAALDNVELFTAWIENGHAYETGDRARYQGNLYKCLQPHTSQPTWTPTDAPSLRAKVLIPDPDVIPEWEQPTGANAYAKGDKVRHNNLVWVSEYDANVWEPGVFGWTQLLEG